MKKIFSKIGDAATSVYNFFDGSKRRIAVVCGVVMSIAPAHTIVYQIANIGLLLFGGADAVEAGSKYIEKKIDEKNMSGHGTESN